MSAGQWLFDLGNTRLKCAPLLDGGRCGPVRALAHEGGDFLAALRAALPEGGEVAWLASVAAPALATQVLALLAQRFRRVSLARTQARFDGLQIAYAEPARLGVDRFLAMAGARTRGPGPWLLAGVGTALTLDLVDAGGRHLGGRIAPSPRLMRQALHGAAAQLPEAGGRYQEFAGDTADALASGCDGAAAALVAATFDAASIRLGHAPTLLLHGGGGQVLQSLLPQAHYAEALVLEGLARWAAGADGNDGDRSRAAPAN
ncbi:MAG: type III pantothenate kinase [Pseudoxanthomonas sp.]